MTPYFERNGITLYCGDCLDILPLLEAGSVACVVTDPPYGIVNQFGVNHGKGTRRMQFAWDDSQVTDRVILALGLAFTVCTERAGVFVFCGADQFGRVLDSLRQGGFTAKPACWAKTCPPPAGKGNWWPSGFELAVYGYRHGAWFGDDDPKRSNVFVSDTYRHGQPGKVDHPTQKPLRLIERLVSAITPPGGTCLDCFNGSGTTLAAAYRLGRKAIGIEIDERYCEIAAKRLDKEMDGRLFTPEPEPKPEQQKLWIE